MNLPRVSIQDNRKEWDRIKKQSRKLNGGTTSVGIFAKGGDPSKDVAARAVVNEYKTKHSPARPFNRQTFDKNQRLIQGKLDLEQRNVIAGKITAKQALSRIGEWYRALLVLTIRRGEFTPLNPKTKKMKSKKGLSEKILIATSDMIRAITHKEKLR